MPSESNVLALVAVFLEDYVAPGNLDLRLVARLLVARQQVGKGVVQTLQIQLDLVAHRKNQVFQLGVAQLVQVQIKKQLLVQILGQLRQRHALLRLGQNLYQCLLNLVQLAGTASYLRLLFRVLL